MASVSINTPGHSNETMSLIGTSKQKIETYPVAPFKRIRILKRADGYQVQLAVQADRHVIHEHTGKQVCVDVGLKAFCGCSMR
jgi:putative transposase